LEEKLKEKGVTQLLVTGVTTDICVQTTMREANDRGYECIMVEDCTESFYPELKKAVFASVTGQNAVVGWTAPSEIVIKALQQA